MVTWHKTKTVIVKDSDHVQDQKREVEIGFPAVVVEETSNPDDWTNV